jgi:hypothetical protein
MRIAYLILAHHQPKHVGAMIEQLDDGNARFFIHVDRKSDIAPFSQAITSGRATLLGERFPIDWGGWNMVRAMLGLLRRAHEEGASDYYQLLSDSCYPIKSNEEIAAKLGAGNFNYITINEEMTPRSYFHDRLIYYRTERRLRKFLKRRRLFKRLKLNEHVRGLFKYGRRLRMFQPRLPGNVRPYKGWQWWCLTHECSEYVLNYVDAHPEFVRFFSSTHIPDESMFQTILANSEFVDTLSPGFAGGVIAGNHYARWSKGEAQGKPCILKEDDLEALIRSDACFARKLSEAHSTRLIELLSERVRRRRGGNQPNKEVCPNTDALDTDREKP